MQECRNDSLFFNFKTTVLKTTQVCLFFLITEGTLNITCISVGKNLKNHGVLLTIYSKEL